jgi:hypothetical protein
MLLNNQLICHSVLMLKSNHDREESSFSLDLLSCLRYQIKHLSFFSAYTANAWFSLHYLWKRAVRITEKSYTPQRDRLCMSWGNPVIFTDCGEIL